ncbi:MAG TPA: CxxC-x17-CxxC domain-containing protein [Candidatus Thermoplasmatota archaeon]|nr:CxxC-x17-CxxC domain-containing protein [Candidatus Thermoplasmatota archaeon]
MHEATCADCGQQTTVPFKPTAGRPVYCRNCFQKRSPPRERSGGYGGGGGGYGGGGRRF